jgi:hypothetical protein
VFDVTMKNSGNVKIATSSFEEIQEWTRFLLSPHKCAAAVNGFLWIGTDRRLLLLAVPSSGQLKGLVAARPNAVITHVHPQGSPRRTPGSASTAYPTARSSSTTRSRTSYGPRPIAALARAQALL